MKIVPDAAEGVSEQSGLQTTPLPPPPSAPTEASKKKKGCFFRFLMLGLIALVVGVTAAYFYVARPAFILNTVLPKVSEASGWDIRAADAEFSPFSAIELRDGQITSPDGDTDVRFDRVSIHYSLASILKKHVEVSEILVQSPVISVSSTVEDRDRRSGSRSSGKESDKDADNRKDRKDGDSGSTDDAEDQQESDGEDDSEKGTGSPLPVTYMVSSVKIQDAQLKVVTKDRAGVVLQTLELSDAEFSAKELGTNSEASASGRAEVLLSVPGNEAEALSKMSLKLDADLSIALSDTSELSGLSSRIRVENQDATGAYANAAGLHAHLALDLTPTEISPSTLRFSRAGTSPLGTIRISGPFDLQDREGALSMNVDGVGAPVLDIVGAAAGLSFNDTLIGADLHVEIRSGGRKIHSKGSVEVTDLQITQEGQNSPIVNISMQEDILLDLKNSKIVLTELAINAVEQNQEIVSVSLSNPTSMHWDEDEVSINDVVLRANIVDLDLSEWSMVLPEAVLGGRVGSRSTVTVTDNGEKIEIQTDSTIAGFRYRTPEAPPKSIDLFVGGGFSWTDQILTIEDPLRVLVAEENARDAKVVSVVAKGEWSQANQSFLASIDANTDLPRTLDLLPAEPGGVSFESGALHVAATIKGTLPVGGDAPLVANITMQTHLAYLSGQLGDHELENLSADNQLIASIDGPDVRLRGISVSLKRDDQAAGTVTAHGSFNQKSGQLGGKLKLEDVPKDVLALATFIALPHHEWKSGSLSGDWEVTGELNAGADLVLAAKGGLTATQALLTSTASPTSLKPIDLAVNADVGVNGTSLTIRELSAEWTPTEKGANKVRFEGSLDLEDPERLAISGYLKGTSLDVRALQGMLAQPKLEADEPDAGIRTHAAETATNRKRTASEVGGSTTGKTLAIGSSPSTSNLPPSGSRPEARMAAPPERIQLPFSDLKLSVVVDAIILERFRIDSLNLATTASASAFALQDFSAKIAGAPVRVSAAADFDHDHPIFQVSGSVKNLQVAPIVDEFAPELRGKFEGILNVNLNLSGAGFDSEHHRRTMRGSFAASFTEADVDIADIANLNVETVTSTRDLVVVLVQAVAPALGIPAKELLHPPLTDLHAHAVLTPGKLKMDRFDVVNAAMKIESAGNVTLDTDLAQSRIDNIPVQFGLATNLAERARIYRADRVSGTYAVLPPFVRVRGTVGEPNVHVDKKVITGLILTGVTERNKIGDEKTTRIIEGIGGLLSGEGPAPTPTPRPRKEGDPEPTPTRKPSDAERVINILQGLQR